MGFASHVTLGPTVCSEGSTQPGVVAFLGSSSIGGLAARPGVVVRTKSESSGLGQVSPGKLQSSVKYLHEIQKLFLTNLQLNAKVHQGQTIDGGRYLLYYLSIHPVFPLHIS